MSRRECSGAQARFLIFLHIVYCKLSLSLQLGSFPTSEVLGLVHQHYRNKLHQESHYLDGLPPLVQGQECRPPHGSSHYRYLIQLHGE
jgi:hypothetical protein